jgi:hypothetical protein
MACMACVFGGVCPAAVLIGAVYRHHILTSLPYKKGLDAKTANIIHPNNHLLSCAATLLG